LKSTVGADASSGVNAEGLPHRARLTDGVVFAFHNRRLLLLLCFVAAVTFADDPILVLSPGLAHTVLHVSSDWAGYFIAALGWGTVAGSVPPTSRGTADRKRTSRRAAFMLCILGGSIVLFAAGLTPLISLVAAFSAGVAGLITGAAAQTLIVGFTDRRTAASVAALWAIAWAGTKPLASLFDGWLAANVGFLRTGVVLAAPALMLAFGELWLLPRWKESIKVWAWQAPHEYPTRPRHVILYFYCVLTRDQPLGDGEARIFRQATEVPGDSQVLVLPVTTGARGFGSVRD
jgi:hypothetical protein